MSINNLLHFEAIITQNISASWLLDSQSRLSLLRLDLLHPVVSGNKWFKLQFYLADAVQNNAKTIATFGGAYSNHIVATAFACQQWGLPCVGYIRGAPQYLSHTLKDAMSYGMQLQFLSRSDYRRKNELMPEHPEYYWIPEGGYGITGAEGAATILSHATALSSYTHIVAATGTGTMLAGLIRGACAHQHVTGISIMKGNNELPQLVSELLSGEEKATFHIEQDYHFGGYAKHPPQLIDYINTCWHQYQLPLDIVYTGKAFFATEQMIRQHTIPAGSNVLFIHSGGLQGNLSLPAGTIPFS
ncbi:1-aminocyclopropane-1-carboxylate deaminase/D-cysteine desulfhydrase [Filimonas effusa]|uniref:Pyridoxal-phosphate dependent enzyme n=1 Tax=Filimonas effusa TaxID=2508721 RepID=A0A4Q1CYY8_9BACT|nr:pyridoxal-phosphate dependent enzyme [Filimonas effusa]RXK80554.1 pyridoxal-phosphate dependent enzyme [Filimonas effusa]